MNLDDGISSNRVGVGVLYYDRLNATVSDIKWLSQNHSRTCIDIVVYGYMSGFTKKFASQFKAYEGLLYWDNTNVFKLCSQYLFNLILEGVYKKIPFIFVEIM